MDSVDEAIFGAIFGAVARGLPEGWEMSVGTLANLQPGNENARFRAMASNPRTNEILTVHGPTELAAVSRLRDALASYRSPWSGQS